MVDTHRSQPDSAPGWLLSFTPSANFSVPHACGVKKANQGFNARSLIGTVSPAPTTSRTTSNAEHDRRSVATRYDLQPSGRVVTAE